MTSPQSIPSPLPALHAPAPPPPPVDFQLISSIELQRLRFAVIGVGGGVGVTTIAALLATAMADKTGLPPRVVDHSGGTIIKLVVEASPSAEHWVYDLGPHAVTATQLLASGVLGHPIIVCSTAPQSIASALAILNHARELTPKSLDRESQEPIPFGVIIINSTSHRKSAIKAAERLQQTIPGAPVIALPWDPTLAMPGAIELSRLSASTLEAADWIMNAFDL